MSSNAQYASVPRLGLASITAGDSSRSAPTQAATVFTAGAGGSRIDRVAAQVGGTSMATTLRLWLHNGSAYTLWAEATFPSVTPTAAQAAPAVVLTSTNSPLFPLVLPAGYSLRASVNDTQLTQAAQADSLVASATINGVAVLGNARFTVTAANTTAVAAAQSTAGAAPLTLTATPYAPVTPSVVTLTSGGNVSAVNFTLTGTDASGTVISEVLSGPNVNTVYSTKAYACVTSIVSSAAVGSNTSAGTAASVGLPTLPAKITITSAANVSAVNFTIRGVDASGANATEVLSGPTAGATVTSVNTYKAVAYISSSGAAATTMVGTPALVSAIAVTANGGDF